jgi:hypothetical protein
MSFMKGWNVTLARWMGVHVDDDGNLQATLGKNIAGEDLTNDVQKVEQRNSYRNIISATTTVVMSNPGFLHSITVNTTAAGAITVYDNTAGSGTKIATLKASIVEQTFVLDVTCAVGLTIVTAAASDITVSYREDA